jgi:hypothetical protein
MLFLTVTIIISALLTLGFPDFHVVLIGPPPRSREFRRNYAPLEYTAGAFAALGYCVSILSIVILPLAWLDIARQSLKLQKSQVTLVIAWSSIFILLIIMVEVPLYVLAASNFRSEAIKYVLAQIIVWSITLGSIAIINLFAFIKVTRIKQMYGMNVAPGSHDRSQEMSSMVRMLTRIQRTSWQLGLLSLLILATLLFSYFRSRRGVYTDPRCYVEAADVLVRCSVLALAYTCGVAVWFVAPTARATTPMTAESVTIT